MIYLSGSLQGEKIAQRLDIGVMIGYRPNNRCGGVKYFHQILWAADNGCFTNPNLDVDKYLIWLQGLLKYQETCLFATAL